MSLAMFASSSRKALLCLVVLLALLIAQSGSLSEAQPVGNRFVYVFLWGSGNLSESGGQARFDVNRVIVGLPYNSKSFKVCFTGAATPGTDFYVEKGYSGIRVSIASNCFTDSWGGGDWYSGARNRYLIKPISDSVSDPNETITATVSADGNNHWGSNYYLLGDYASASFTIRGG